jgi:predicted DNA-binding transcriptional regulator AlpA
MSEDKMFNILLNRYNTVNLSREQVAEVLGLSSATVDRMRYEGLGPNYMKLGHSRNATIKYSLHKVVEYLFIQNIECA